MRICAWCNKELEVADHSDPLVITHGICPDCIIFIKSKKVSMRDFVNSFREPIIVVDWDVKAETANDAYLKFAGIGLSQITGKFGGELLECEYSFTAEGCGKSVCCSGCMTRKAITYTYQTGESLKNVESFHHVKNADGTIRRITLFISTEKLNDCVLVRMDKIEDLPS